MSVFKVLCNYMLKNTGLYIFKAASSSQGRKPDIRESKGKAIKENVTY